MVTPGPPKLKPPTFSLLWHPVIDVLPAFFSILSKGQLLQLGLIEFLTGFLEGLQTHNTEFDLIQQSFPQLCKRFFSLLTCLYHKCFQRSCCIIRCIHAITINVWTTYSVPSTLWGAGHWVETWCLMRWPTDWWESLNRHLQDVKTVTTCTKQPRNVPVKYSALTLIFCFPQ